MGILKNLIMDIVFRALQRISRNFLIISILMMLLLQYGPWVPQFYGAILNFLVLNTFPGLSASTSLLPSILRRTGDGVSLAVMMLSPLSAFAVTWSMLNGMLQKEQYAGV